MRLNIVLFFMAVWLPVTFTEAQVPYARSIQKFQREYVVNHEVVTNKDKKFFRFYPPSSDYKIEATFTRIWDTTGFMMPTSGREPKRYFRYGYIRFSLQGKNLQLTVFQSKDLMTDPTYRDYLFLPFTDLTSGEESYGGGRYIDLAMKDIKSNKLMIDFNKGYNPYCAYSSGYNCPIPPRENDLPIAIRAGEKQFAKPGH